MNKRATIQTSPQKKISNEQSSSETICGWKLPFFSTICEQKIALKKLPYHKNKKRTYQSMWSISNKQKRSSGGYGRHRREWKEEVEKAHQQTIKIIIYIHIGYVKFPLLFIFIVDKKMFIVSSVTFFPSSFRMIYIFLGMNLTWVFCSWLYLHNSKTHCHVFHFNFHPCCHPKIHIRVMETREGIIIYCMHV